MNRNPQTETRLIRAAHASVLVVDVQTKLMPAVADGERLCAQLALFLDFLEDLELPVILTEHCAERIGTSVPQVVSDSRTRLKKRHFSAIDAHPAVLLAPKPQVIVTGAEAHVCVLQTVAGLLHAGREVFVVEELVGSRDPRNKALALQRMAGLGASVVSMEMVFFECIAHADHPKFRELLDLIRNH